MQLLPYTEDHHRFRARLRKFMAEEVVPCVEEWEKEHIVPRDIWKKMGREGFVCPALSREYGGGGGDFLHSAIVIEEIARTNHSGLATPLHSDIVVPYIESYASEELKRKYLPLCAAGEMITAVAMTEPDAGSDLASMQTTAEADGDDIVLNGSKTFITNGINCDLVIVAAKQPGADNPHKALSLYLVEDGTPGFNKGRRLEKMGFHSQDTAELFFTDCRIPQTNRLGAEGAGFYMLMEKLQQERLVCAVMGVAAAEQIMEWTMRHCRETVGPKGPLTRSQAVSFALVEMCTDVKLGRTFLDKLIVQHMAGENIVIETSMAKYWTTELAKRIADRALDLIGQGGTLETTPPVRAFRDARVMSIFAGTNEIMKGIVAKFMGM
ncbi:MAG: acyl-CoA dehydrogenase family protein [Thermodesulfobacteriota bacterium]